MLQREPNWQILEGDCLEVMREMEADSVDAVVTDPPYGLNFMGKEFDKLGENKAQQVWHEAWAREALRVLKPGGHLLAFGGTRTYHRLVCAIEDAGFEIRDSVQWIYGSGFPKSLNVGKAIDKMAPREGMFSEFAKHFAQRRKASRLSQKDIAQHFPSKTGGLTGCVWNWENAATVPTVGQWRILQPLLGLSDEWLPLIERIEAEREVVDKAKWTNSVNHFVPGEDHTRRVNLDITAPATEAAKQWEGWGTALKPAHEPIVLARKPLSASSVARQVLATGTGALNIDGCRVAGMVEDPPRFKRGWADAGSHDGYKRPAHEGYGPQNPPHQSGRWPANLLLSHKSIEVAVLSRSIPLEARRVIEEYFSGYDRVQELRQEQGRLPERNAQGTRDILLAELQGNVSAHDHGRKPSEVREEAYAGSQGKDALGDEKTGLEGAGSPELEGRLPHRERGLRLRGMGVSAGTDENPNGDDEDQSRIRDGAQDAYGPTPRPATPANGDGPPHQRQERRQQAGKPRDVGQGAALSASSGDGQGVGAAPTRERTLEVLACDVPLQWGHYFHLTAENLGCRATGEVRRVKASVAASGPTLTGHSTSVARGKFNGVGSTPNYADPDGTEAVEAWECAEGCPIRLMDEQSGTLKSGALDRSRITAENKTYGKAPKDRTGTYQPNEGGASRFFQQFSPDVDENGCVEGCPVREMDEQSGQLHARGNIGESKGGGGMYGHGPTTNGFGAGDKGGASRFFQRFEGSPEPGFKYVAKASRAERNKGLDDAPATTKQGVRPNSADPTGKFPDHDHRPAGGNNHPTVKPINLMKYLCRLITPPNGTVLDPFAGSASTGCAAVQEGFNFIGIEKEAEYVEIARRRIAYWSQPTEAEAKKNGKVRSAAPQPPKPQETSSTLF